jgi:hypothetical protein
MSAPLSVQLSFVVNNVRGMHVGKQAVVVAVAGQHFYLVPRITQSRFRFYDCGFTLFLNPNQPIKMTMGIISPVAGNKGYLHCVAQYVVQPQAGPVIQTVDVHPFGDVYTINMSLYICHSYVYVPIDDREKSPEASRED